MSLDDYGWDEGWAAAFADVDSGDRGLTPARIIAVHQRYSDVVTNDGQEVVWNSIPPARLRPATGDWVALSPDVREDRRSVDTILPRRSRLLRRINQRGGDPDVSAANLDLVLVVAPLASPIGDVAVAAYLGLALESGARVELVMPKRDLHEDALREVERIKRVVAPPHLRVHPVDSKSGQGLEAVVVRPRETATLLGPSGAGKSTLLNRLMGSEIQRTGELSGAGTGKHTTSSRQLRRLPTGALLVDTPGIGNVKGAVDWDIVRHAFDDITELGEHCRFNNCSHQGDDGCAIAEAVADGELDPQRFELYRSLSEPG